MLVRRVWVVEENFNVQFFLNALPIGELHASIHSERHMIFLLSYAVYCTSVACLPDCRYSLDLRSTLFLD